MKHAICLLALPCFLLFVATAQQSRHSEIKIDPKTFDQFAGLYSFADNPDRTVSLFREGDKFFVQPLAQQKSEIFAETENKFFLKTPDVEAAFVRDAQGKVTGLVWRQNGQERQARKISNEPRIDVFVSFEKREEMIRMRDGVRLHTLIFTPKDHADALPFLLNRTPYGIGEMTSDGINQSYFHLVQDGYIFVIQDIRGRFESGGRFTMNRPPREKKDDKSTDESTDTYDTIEWLIKNVPKNNGRAGILGGSYDGWLAAVATIDAHPALKASSPQAPMTDVFLGDDFFHNGAFRQTYGYEYVKAMESSKKFDLVTID